MARDLVLDVIARKNSRDLNTLADEFDRAARQTDDFGDKLNKTNRFSKYLDDQLLLTKQKVRELGVEFERTGDKDVFAKLRGAQGNVKSLERIKTDLTKSFGDTGAEASNAFSAGFVGGLGRVALAASPALAPMAVMLVAELLAAVGGAITAGAGLGGVFAGAITQIKTNPDVQAAAGDLGHWFSEQWKLDTGAFAEPTRDAIALIKTELRGPMDDLRKDFSVIAPYTRDFANSLGVAAQKFMPGLNRLLQNSGPLIQEAGHDLEILSEAVSRFMIDLSEGEKGEAEALRTLVRGLADLITFTGGAINVSAHLWDGYVQGTRSAVDWADKWLGKITLIHPLLRLTGAKERIDEIAGAYNNLGPAVGRILPPISSVTREVDNQKRVVDGLTKSWNDWFGVSMGVDQALLSLNQSETALTESIKENGRHWELNTKTGQANYGTLLSVIQAAHDYRDAQIASGVSADQANAEYQKTIEAQIGMAQKFGLSAAQANSLRTQVGGLSDALDSLRTDITIRTHFITEGTPPSSFYHGLATGGRVPGYAGGGGTIRVGEQGPEYLSFGPGPAYVTPNSAINGAANSGGAGGENVLRVILQWPDGQVLSNQLVNYGRRTGRNTVEKLLPVSTSR